MSLTTIYSTIHLSWSAPEFLDNTERDIDINYYLIYQTTSANDEQRILNTTFSSVSFTKEVSADIACANSVTFQISAVNSLGVGEKSLAITGSFYSSKHTLELFFRVLIINLVLILYNHKF